MTLRVLVFDVDGTLAETEEAHREAFNDTFEAVGLRWHWSREDYSWLLRTTGGKDPFDVEPLVAAWCSTYDLFVRLQPDVPLRADGVRSTSDRFRDEIETILNTILPRYVPDERLVTLCASDINEAFDWAGLLERLFGPPEPGKPPVAKSVALHPTLWD